MNMPKRTEIKINFEVKKPCDRKHGVWEIFEHHAGKKYFIKAKHGKLNYRRSEDMHYTQDLLIGEDILTNVEESENIKWNNQVNRKDTIDKINQDIHNAMKSLCDEGTGKGILFFLEIDIKYTDDGTVCGILKNL